MTYHLHLLIMELHFDAILFSKLGNAYSDAGHIKCSRGPHLARGFPTPDLHNACWHNLTTISFNGQNNPLRVLL